MQMAKVSVALRAFKNRQLPYIAINKDPTYGGVSASYAMQVSCLISSLLVDFQTKYLVQM